MKNIVFRIIVVLMLLAISLVSFVACGDKSNSDSQGGDSGLVDVSSNESYFEWEDNRIIALTDKGRGQKNLKIPARCEGFSGTVFNGSDVESVVFEDDDNVELGMAFMGAAKLTRIELPNGLVTIPSMGFRYCRQLKKITIPDTVSTIDKYAFNSCAALSEVIFEGDNIKNISAYSFEGCKSLKSIDLPDSVEVICESAFSDCNSLEKITMGDKITKIEKYSFSNTVIKELHFPEKLQITYIDKTAFGMNLFSINVYVVKGSWCDLNRDSWNVGFAEIKYE